MYRRILTLALALLLIGGACAGARADETYTPVATVDGRFPMRPAATPAPTTKPLPMGLLPPGGHTLRWQKGLPLPYVPGQPLFQLIVTQMAAFDCFTLVCDGEAAMIDCGTTRNLYDVLRAAGVDKFKFVFNTHPHGDHENGFPELLSRVPTEVFYTRFPPDYDEEQRKLMREMKKVGVPVEVLAPGTVLKLGGATLELFDVMHQRITNNQSTVVKITYGKRTLLLTADIGAIAQKELTGLYGDRFDVDILKIPHHGLELLAPEFVAAASPEEVFITYREFDGVTSDTVDQLRRMGFEPFFAAMGTLVFTTDGGDYWLIEQREYIPPEE